MIVVKIGGSIVGGMHPSAMDDVGRIAAAEEGGAIIVHGGGKDVTAMCERLGVEPRFVTSPGGIRSRYTDAQTAEIFAMVMAGRVRTDIVRRLQGAGVNAVGLSGVDGRTIEAERKARLVIVNEKGRKQAIDGGYTGKIRAVNAALLGSLLGAGMVPVVSPVAIGTSGELLNVDGDRAAAYVAGAAGAGRVVFITDVDGLLDEGGALVPSLTRSGAEKARAKAGAGMEKKLLAAGEALSMGVGEAVIASGRRQSPITRAIAHEQCTVISGD